MPQTSPTSVDASALSRQRSPVRSRTPSVLAEVFARRLAILARVLVSAMPMLIGSPVHCCTVRFRSWQNAVRSCGIPVRSRKHSSIELFLHRRDQFPEDLHHPVAHVGIEREVSADDRNAVPLDEVFCLERRLRHLDAERLRLVAARDDAAVVRRQGRRRGGLRVPDGRPRSQETKKLLQSASP